VYLVGFTTEIHYDARCYKRQTYFLFFSELGLVLTNLSLICIVLHCQQLLHLVANNCVLLRSNKVKENSIHQLVRIILHIRHSNTGPSQVQINVKLSRNI
jgi:hypothetical protein